MLIRNAEILGKGKKDILIENGRISEIKENIEKQRGEETLEASSLILLPGFINGHTHVAMTGLRGYGEGLKLHDWLQKVWQMEEKFTDRITYLSALLGLAEMLESGTIGFIDMYRMGIKGIVQAAEELGLKANIEFGMFGKDIEGEKRDFEEFVRQPSGKNIWKTLSAHSPYTCSEELILQSKELAEKQKLTWGIHISETRRELYTILEKHKLRPIEYLDKLGVLNERTLLFHASWASKREIGLVAERKSTVVSNPISNLKLATGGIAPVSEYLEEGVRVLIGTDGAVSNNSLNILESAKMLALLQFHKYWDPLKIKPREIIRMLTINAKGFIPNYSGKIEAGEPADFILINRNNLPLDFTFNRSWIYSISPKNIEYVFIDGEPKLKEGRVDIDLGGIREELNSMLEELRS